MLPSLPSNASMFAASEASETESLVAFHKRVICQNNVNDSDALSSDCTMAVMSTCLPVIYAASLVMHSPPHTARTDEEQGLIPGTPAQQPIDQMTMIPVSYC